MQCYARDEGWPLGGGVQTRPPNYLELLPLRAVVVSVKEKGAVKWGSTPKPRKIWKLFLFRHLTGAMFWLVVRSTGCKSLLY